MHEDQMLTLRHSCSIVYVSCTRCVRYVTITLLCYVMPTILYQCDTWCLNGCKMGILQSMVRAICGVQLKDRKRAEDLTVVLGSNETLDRLAMAISVHWYVLSSGDGHMW